MSAVVLEHCPGCGKCTRHGVCPVNAISIENGKAVIGQGCIECGLCLSTCPIGLIKAEKEPESLKVELSSVESREEVANGQQTSTGS